ncbi:MAG: HEAT repeat domain-containing protein [Candidatus Euphemobacter frigidus]|nr:HEAT repeat domain-containing protein [Candidatus Euphemobacter frigidus]MDP8275534.1 HEAT repeat domain-containing protein [Candidatus Euphemobacter frigidus]
MKTCIFLLTTGLILAVSPSLKADREKELLDDSMIKLPDARQLGPEKKQKLYAFLGKIYEEKGDFRRAVQAYRQALKISPDDLLLRSALAAAYLESGEEESANQEYVMILESCARDLTDPIPSVRLEAIKNISRIPGPKADALLLETLNDPDPSVRQAGALALGRWGDEQVIPMLIRIVDNRRLSTDAISILARMKVDEAVPAIAKHLSDDHLGHRRNTAHYLGMMGDPQALDYLLPCLKDESYLMRKTTVYALWQLHDPRAIPPLIEALNDDAAIVKKLAAYSLGKLGDPEAIEPLEKLLKDTTDSNHLYAALALVELGVPVDTRIFLDELDADDFFYRGTAIEGLAASGDPVVAEAIIPMLEDRSAWVRIIAARTLTTLNLPASHGALTKSLTDSDRQVRAYAAAALWNLGDGAGAELLSELMASPYPEYRESAARALKYVNDESRQPLLQEALNDPSLIIRRIAEESLTQQSEQDSIE